MKNTIIPILWLLIQKLKKIRGMAGPFEILKVLFRLCVTNQKNNIVLSIINKPPRTNTYILISEQYWNWILKAIEALKIEE